MTIQERAQKIIDENPVTKMDEALKIIELEIMEKQVIAMGDIGEQLIHFNEHAEGWLKSSFNYANT